MAKETMYKVMIDNDWRMALYTSFWGGMSHARLEVWDDDDWVWLKCGEHLDCWEDFEEVLYWVAGFIDTKSYLVFEDIHGHTLEWSR